MTFYSYNLLCTRKEPLSVFLTAFISFPPSIFFVSNTHNMRNPAFLRAMIAMFSSERSEPQKGEPRMREGEPREGEPRVGEREGERVGEMELGLPQPGGAPEGVPQPAPSLSRQPLWRAGCAGSAISGVNSKLNGVNGRAPASAVHDLDATL